MEKRWCGWPRFRGRWCVPRSVLCPCPSFAFWNSVLCVGNRGWENTGFIRKRAENESEDAAVAAHTASVLCSSGTSNHWVGNGSEEGRGVTEGEKGLVLWECSASGAWIAGEDVGKLQNQKRHGASRRSCFFLGPSTGTRSEVLKTPKKMPLLCVCEHLAASKSSLNQQVPGLISGLKVHWGL